MITKEKLEHHISHLQEKHKFLEYDCEEAYRQGDDLRWEKIKKMKLKLKDEIEKCRINLLNL